MWKGKGFDKKTKKEYKVVEGKGFANETFDDFVLLKYEDEKKTAKKKVEKKIVETPKLKSGKGGEFYETGEKKFEGGYLKGIRSGYGKEFYKSGNVKFEGEYLNG